MMNSRDNFKALHLIIRDDLLSKIKAGGYRSGDQLPTENELTKIYQASKSPVRQALDSLRAEGVIYRHPGRGTFVSNQEKWGWTIGSIQDLLGLGPSSQIDLHAFTHGEKAEEYDRVFDQKRGKYTRIEGVRISQGKPVFFFIAILPNSLGRMLQLEDFRDKSTFAAIESKLNIRVKKCIQQISAVLADLKLAKTLKVSTKSPLLHIDRVYYDEKDQVVQWTRSFFRSDLTKYQTILSRE